MREASARTHARKWMIKGESLVGFGHLQNLHLWSAVLHLLSVPACHVCVHVHDHVSCKTRQLAGIKKKRMLSRKGAMRCSSFKLGVVTGVRWLTADAAALIAAVWSVDINLTTTAAPPRDRPLARLPPTRISIPLFLCKGLMCLKTAVDEILADSKGNKKIQTEHPQF